MKTQTSLWMLLCLTMLWTACQQVDQAQKAVELAKNSEEIAETLQEELEKGEAKLEERRAKGDTSALHYTELAKFLPERIPGYLVDGEPEGQNVNMNGLSYSQVEQDYRASDGSELTITLVDYYMAQAMYQAATTMFNMGLEIDTNDEMLKGFDAGVEGVKGIEKLEKKDREASVLVAVSNRFFINIEAENQNNTELVKQVCKSMGLAGMTKY